MDEKIFIKERKKMPTTLVVIITSIIGAIIGSLLTYFVVDEKISSVGNKNSTINTRFEIEKTDSPVVAIAQKAGPSIVGVKINAISQNLFGGLQQSDEEGSGIIYSQDGYIITNYHVVETAIKNSTAKVIVTLPNTEEAINATVVGGDKTTDLAVIKVDKSGLPAAEFGSSKDLKVGELAVAIGNPLGQEFAGSVTVGYISALNRKLTTDGRTYSLLQTDAAINPGNSGGALVNSQGQVIGINTAKIGATEVEGLGFAIPTDDALPIIKELIQNKKIVRPFIGMSGINIDENTAKSNNIEEGIYIAQVFANTPAAQAGIKKGDIVVEIDGKKVKKMEELNEIKNTKKVGDEVTLKVNRAGKYVDIKLTLAADDTVNENLTN